MNHSTPVTVATVVRRAIRVIVVIKLGRVGHLGGSWGATARVATEAVGHVLLDAAPLEVVLGCLQVAPADWHDGELRVADLVVGFALIVFQVVFGPSLHRVYDDQHESRQWKSRNADGNSDYDLRLVGFCIRLWKFVRIRFVVSLITFETLNRLFDRVV